MALSVGFIGVGNMGNPMAGNILKAGFPMAVFDLNPKAMANLVEAGARRADSALAALEGADVVLTSLPASPDVEAMYLDAGGLVERAKPGTILIDLSSVLPSTPRKIEPKAKARGVHFLEAPVSGGVTGARAATLAIMVGGDKAALSRAEPVLKAMGPNVFHVGSAGAGNTVKAINNMMACVNSATMMEGFVLGVKAGLDPKIVDAIRDRRTPKFDDPKAQIVYDVAKSLHDGHGVSRTLYDEAVKLVGERGIVEIIGLCGYYTMVSMTLNTFEFDLPDGEVSELA